MILRALVLGLITAFIAPAPASADGWAELRKTLAKVRTGDTASVSPALVKLAGKGPRLQRAAAALVLARVQAAAGKARAARAALRKAKPMRRISAPSWAWAEIEVQLAEGSKREALEALGVLRRKYPKFRWAAADLLFSRLQEEVGQPTAAAQTALSLYRKSRLHLPGDELLDRAARMLDGPSPTQARKLWKRLALEHPESPLAERALRRIGPLTVEERFERVETLFARRAYEACRAEAKPLWDAGHRKSETGYYLGKIGSERLRDDHAGAVSKLRVAAKDGEPFARAALSSLAIVLAKLGRTDESVATFDRWLERYREAPLRRRVEAHYDRGRALHTGGRSRQAGDDMARFLAAHESGFDWHKYQWFAGWWTWQAGDYAVAIKRFRPLLAKKNPLVGGKARYWTARAQMLLGKKKKAISTMTNLARRMPLTWYGGLAAQRLAEWGAGRKVPRARDLTRYGRRPSDPFAGLPRGIAALNRLKAAVHLGEPDTARRVLKVVRRRLVADLGEERTGQLVRDLADPLERIHEARRAAYVENKRVIRRAPTRKTVGVWRDVYPRAYRTHVRAAAKRFDVPEYMLYAHMLQESRYNPAAISGAPAYGALQLLDRTARRLARGKAGAAALYDSYQLWMLMEPRHNVPLGASYLGALIHKFHGQVPFAIGSYNGGPMLFERVLKTGAKLPFDALIEEIAPHESRNYTRKVGEHVLRYLAIYEKPADQASLRAKLLPATWKAVWREHPDY